MTNPDKHMPDEIFVFNDKSSIGDFGFTSMSPKYGYIKYNRASPNQCCGAVGKEACMRRDQDGEECDVKRAGVDDGLLAEAVETLRKHISAPQHYYLQPFEKHIETIITHALKSREKPVEMTVDKLISLHGCYGAVRAHELIKYHNGIKIIDGGA